MRVLTSVVFLMVSGITLAAPDFGPVNMASFYTSLPDVNQNAPLGTLVKAEKISTTIPGVQAWKIAYISSDTLGHKTLVTGTVAAPENAVSHAPRPIVAWAHGTTGTAQTCGPSEILNPVQPLNQYFLPSGNSWTDFGLPGMRSFIKLGYVMVATDYQGLGGGGKHQYAVAATQAHDVINAIRAVTQLKDVNAGDKAVVYGWSQGGGATIAAASSGDYINQKGTAKDGINIVGFVAMAPYDISVVFPADVHNEADAAQFMQKLGALFSNDIFGFTHYAQNIWGMTAAFPNLKLDDIFTPEGAKSIDQIMQQKCVHVAVDTMNYIYGADYKKLLRPTPKNAMAWIDANKKGGVPPVKPVAPVVIYFGNKDTALPPIMRQLYYKQMCQLGANIKYVQLPGDQTHYTTPGVAERFYVKWVADRFAGKPAENGCKA